MAATPFAAEWVQQGADIFQWGRKAAYWKGRKGWWASRQDVEGIKGPFRTPGAAQKWAEEPLREQHRLAQQKLREVTKKALEDRKAKRANQKAAAAEQAQEREARDRVTWNGLGPEERRVQPGQVWAMKDPRFEQHQVLVIEVKKTLAIVLARQARATPWKGLEPESRTLSHLPRTYHLVGMAKVPGPAARSRVTPA